MKIKMKWEIGDKNFKTFNHKWEYTLYVHIKIRKEVNKHKNFSQVHINYNILTSVNKIS